MSKRHQSSRRKAYGRRQHEIHERSARRPELEPLDGRVERFGHDVRTDARSIAEPFSVGFRFALAD